MLLREPLKDRAAGRWPGILSALGVPDRSLRNRHGPCPMCGGRDRFRFDNKGGRGTWICSKCGAGDGIELVKQFLGVDFKAAAVRIEEHVGAAPVVSSSGAVVSDEKLRAEMAAMWKRSKPLDLRDPAGRYLHERTGLVDFPDKLRFCPDERYVDQGARPTWHPVMLAKVDPSDKAAADGERAALHRTYLNAFGNKADVKAPKKALGTMPTGAAVRLMPHGTLLGIAEGIETALSASVLYNVPVWAALNAALLEQWRPPETVETVMIFGDNDASSTGQAAAYGLASKLKARGLHVIVEIPTRTGDDWNDVQMRQLKKKM